MVERDEEDEGFLVGEAICVHATDAAIKCNLETNGSFRTANEVWVPQSQIHDNSDVWKKGDRGKLIVTTWFAEKEGWSE